MKTPDHRMPLCTPSFWLFVGVTLTCCTGLLYYTSGTLFGLGWESLAVMTGTWVVITVIAILAGTASLMSGPGMPKS